MDESLSEEGLVGPDDKVFEDAEGEAKEIDSEDR